MRRILITIIVLCFTGHMMSGQSTAKMTRDEYVEFYKDLAIKEMHRSGVPASITLAQGMLESDNGNSRLALKANNHFGIKCHSDWKGKRIYHDDDERRECFRKYKTVYDSYADHSDFLMNGSRYTFLFELDPTDYKGWAKGLKKAGYATSNKYADLLIRIIEENELHQYDLAGTEIAESRPDRRRTENRLPAGREILINNRIDYIIVQEGDSFASLNNELGLLKNELFRYNELTPDSTLEPGQILYLQPKRNKAEAGLNTHVLKEGESLYGISQQYGIRLEKLLLRNNLKKGEEPEPGTTVYLRKGHRLRLNIGEEEEPEEEMFEFEFEE